MIKINWKEDYRNEFTCPYCNKLGLKIKGWTRSKNDKKVFVCINCSKFISASKNIKVIDPNAKVNWRRDYQLGEFICPNVECNAKEMRLLSIHRGKQQFRCGVCRTIISESINLSSWIVSRISHHTCSITPFYFDDNKWDLRAIIPSVNEQDIHFYINFQNVKQDWFRYLVKRYIYHQCKIGDLAKTISCDLCHLRIFSRCLAEQNITTLSSVNRDIIIKFINQSGNTVSTISHRLGVLRKFLWTGNIQNWFKIEQDLIRDDDFPKRKVVNPDPISDKVREQIESNLHRLPEPIARMWLIAFFTAMRPSELAQLRRDCLIQDGSTWKITWMRKKSKDQHELPITRTIAKIVQEQQEYIEYLWGNDWNYLFCHYQGFSKTDVSQENLKPIKKAIPNEGSIPLKMAIRCLIKVLDIRDENGKLANFSPCLVRSTRLTQLFEQGHDLTVVSAWAGHQQLETTALHYTHVSCDLIEKEAGHIQKALFNADGQYLNYESLPKSFWKNLHAHKLELPGDHINTPIYGYCSLSLDQDCDKFRACYTCHCFVAVPEKLPLYIKTHDELRAKETRAMEAGADVLVEQYQKQANQLHKIIASLETTG